MTRALLAAGLAVVAIGALRAGHFYDEGVVAYGAERIVRGEVPYRDFWHFMAPGAIYYFAGLFDLFGISIATARAGAAAAPAAVLVVLHRLGRRFLTERDAALFAAAYVAIAAASVPLTPIASHHWPSTLTALVAAAAFLDGRWALCGAAVGLTASFHQGKGAAIACGVLAARLLSSRSMPSARAAARFTLGAAAAAAPWVVALVAAGAARSAFEQTVLYLPNRWTQWMLYYGDAAGPVLPRLGPFCIVYGAPLGLAWVLWLWVRRRPDGIELAPAAILGAALWATSLYRPHGWNLQITSPLAALVAFAVVVRSGGTAARAARGLLAVSAAMAIAYLAVDLAHAEPVRTRRGVLWADPYVPLGEWVDAVERNVPPGGRTFIAPYMSGLYFYAGVRNATSFDLLAPGLQNTPAHVAQALGEVEARAPARVFDSWDVYTRFTRRGFRLAPDAFFREDPLRRLLEERYESVEETWGLVVWRLRSSGA